MDGRFVGPGPRSGRGSHSEGRRGHSGGGGWMEPGAAVRLSKPTELNPTRRELWRTKLKTLGSSPRRGGNAGRAVLEELEEHRGRPGGTGAGPCLGGAATWGVFGRSGQLATD